VPELLDGKAAIVGGGAGGMGRASALALARRGASVVVADLNADAAAGVVREIEAGGGRAHTQPFDAADLSSAEAVVARTLDLYGRLDVLANFVGLSLKGEVLTVADDVWHRTMAVNLDGTFYLTRAAARPMVAQGSGTMILVASDRGLYGKKGGAHFAASKAGIIAYAKSLALELGRSGVTVNALNPGTTDTPHVHESTPEEVLAARRAFDPLGKLSTPEDIAEIVLFLAGPGGRFMTGQLITTRMRNG